VIVVVWQGPLANAPDDIQDRQVRGLEHHAGAGTARFTEDFQDRVGLRDGAADDVTDGLTAPFGQRGPAIGYEAVNVEH